MSRDWQFRVRDILDAIAKIERYIAGLTYEHFVNDELRVDAVARNLEIIGEASSHIPQDIQMQYSTIPWIDIRNMRNILVHVYHGVDLGILWDTCTHDLPLLKSVMQAVVEAERS
jgi:uncharacterized protein with HEPN domain